MDLSTLDLAPGADAGATMKLLHPVTGDPLPITFHVLGQDSPTYRANLRRLRDMLAKQRDEVDDDADPDVRELTRIAQAAACAVKGWTGVAMNGETLPYTFDNAVSIFTSRPWVGEQVRFFRDRRANFFAASPPSSGEQF